MKNQSLFEVLPLKVTNGLNESVKEVFNVASLYYPDVYKDIKTFKTSVVVITSDHITVGYDNLSLLIELKWEWFYEEPSDYGLSPFYTLRQAVKSAANSFYYDKCDAEINSDDIYSEYYIEAELNRIKNK